ncbi:hypothetical protein C7974DRAFT_379303 [Boeremia exigua]|uniref:uncharacterized protein n=1 Tax=Boeremia exigua TaxID=749465 RepID=UPI001E8D5021|nr:uncharacterized protein C7974DRAFT_379303 [Boeremia exigua]KAH6616384.1 hypothetical protein C7974DRAFT_379303 [Boeremia exigua]
MKGSILAPAAACISQSIWISFTMKSQWLDILAVYDAASRDPLRAAPLLWILRIRRLACVGALLTLLAVGIEPTVQQAITIQAHRDNALQQAYVPRAQNFLQIASPNSSSMEPSVPTNSMIGTLFNGLFFGSMQSGKASLDVVPSCPSGNCTFPAYQTLAACYKCQDSASAVVEDCIGWKNPYNTDRRTCHYRLPNSLQLNQTAPVRTEHHSTTFGKPTIAASAQLPLVIPTSYGENIMNLAILNGTNGEVKGNMSISGSQCVLYWCIKTLEAEVTDGQFHEYELRSWIDKDAIIKGDLVLDKFHRTFPTLLSLLQI